MNVALVNPSSEFLIDERVFPPLGVLWVAAELELAGHTVSVIDTPVTGVAGYDAVGFTCTTPQFESARKIAEVSRALDPLALIVIGGPHATVNPLSCEEFDRVVIGEGFWLDWLARTSEKFVEPPLVQDISSLPLPARHLIDMNSYHYQIDGRKATNVISQFGCPMRCTFCCGRSIPFYRKVRYMSPVRVMYELDQLNRDYGYTAFTFFDDEMNINTDRLLELCDRLKGRDYLWRGFIRADRFTPEIARAMAEAGCREVGCGVESGSDRILKLVQKGTSYEVNGKARLIAKAMGIRFKAFTIVGLPTEDYQSVEDTRRWLLEFEPDDFDTTVFVPYRGCLIADQPDEFAHGLNFTLTNAAYKGKPGEYHSPVSTPALSSDEIVRLRDETERTVRESLGLAPR